MGALADRERIEQLVEPFGGELQINVELGSPPGIIPVSPGWEDRGGCIAQVGRVGFFHFESGRLDRISS